MDISPLHIRFTYQTQDNQQDVIRFSLLCLGLCMNHLPPLQWSTLRFMFCVWTTCLLCSGPLWGLCSVYEPLASSTVVHFEVYVLCMNHLPPLWRSTLRFMFCVLTTCLLCGGPLWGLCSVYEPLASSVVLYFEDYVLCMKHMPPLWRSTLRFIFYVWTTCLLCGGTLWGLFSVYQPLASSVVVHFEVNVVWMNHLPPLWWSTLRLMLCGWTTCLLCGCPLWGLCSANEPLASSVDVHFEVYVLPMNHLPPLWWSTLIFMFCVWTTCLLCGGPLWGLCSVYEPLASSAVVHFEDHVLCMNH